MENAHKKVKIIDGDGKNLNISEVSSHLNIAKPKKNESKQEIVVPKPKKTNKN